VQQWGTAGTTGGSVRQRPGGSIGGLVLLAAPLLTALLWLLAPLLAALLGLLLTPSLGEELAGLGVAGTLLSEPTLLLTELLGVAPVLSALVGAATFLAGPPLLLLGGLLLWLLLLWLWLLALVGLLLLLWLWLLLLWLWLLALVGLLLLLLLLASLGLLLTPSLGEELTGLGVTWLMLGLLLHLLTELLGVAPVLTAPVCAATLLWLLFLLSLLLPLLTELWVLLETHRFSSPCLLGGKQSPRCWTLDS
jgi:hypothetical protein